jgi:hypothetical protein
VTPEHRDRTIALDALAGLAGFDARLPSFGDGRVPDVLRLDLRTGGLFVGDAKEADGPRTAETYLRLRRYVSWGSAHLNRPGRYLVIALAVPRWRADAWEALLEALTTDVGIEVDRRTRTTLGGTSVVTVEAFTSRSRQMPKLLQLG